MRTPSQPRLVLPYLISWATTPLARFEGMAKPIPTEPPEGEIAVLMPITSPFSLNIGPPELPLLIGASVWMN